MNAPTLTLRIPFILLGRKDVMNPNDWAREERFTRPVRQIYEALRAFCVDVPLRFETGVDTAKGEEGWSIQTNTSLEDGGGNDDGLSEDERTKLGKGVWVCFLSLLYNIQTSSLTYMHEYRLVPSFSNARASLLTPTPRPGKNSSKKPNGYFAS
jgi:hypothetical protein